METREKPPTRRLFFALCPDAALRLALKRLLRKALPRGAGRAVPVDNLHVTLVFLGQVDEEAAACAVRAGDEVRCPPFRLVLDHLHHWPRPRILWLGPRYTPPQLFTLVGDLRQRLQPCGLSLDARPYQAHMTVMRKVGRAPAPCEVPPLAWDVTRFSLMESVSGEGGVRYHERHSWPLREGA